MTTCSDKNLVWLDLEMTGLDPNVDRILEIATIVTDPQMNILAEGPVIAVHQSDEQLAKMNSWNQKHHGESGLIDRVKASTVHAEEAAAQTLDFIKAYVPAGASPLCGNTVSQDRRFMINEMPALANYFHYRHLDVSTLKILFMHWAPEIYDAYKKESTHQALQDIRDSIDELKYYRQHLDKLMERT